MKLLCFSSFTHLNLLWHEWHMWTFATCVAVVIVLLLSLCCCLWCFFLRKAPFKNDRNCWVGTRNLWSLIYSYCGWCITDWDLSTRPWRWGNIATTLDVWLLGLELWVPGTLCVYKEIVNNRVTLVCYLYKPKHCVRRNASLENIKNKPFRFSFIFLKCSFAKTHGGTGQYPFTNIATSTFTAKINKCCL